jgi:hypothetical protein
VVEITALLSNTSVRTLILGIDQSGRIVQHDRNAPEVLVYDSETLAGTPLSELVVGPTATGSPLDGLLEAAKAGREATAVLAVRVRRVGAMDAVTSVQPMQGDDTALATLVILRMPEPGDERFVDPALMRHALLEDTFRRIGSTLDLDQLARGLIGIVVPHFCNAAGLLVLDSLAAIDENPVHPPDGSQLLRRIAVATDDGPTCSAWKPASPSARPRWSWIARSTSPSHGCAGRSRSCSSARPCSCCR